jgi:hypothetical protein
VFHGWLTYVFLVAVAVVVVVLLVRAFWIEPARVVAGIGLIAVAALYLAFRQGYSRHDLGHQQFFYLVAIGLLAWLLGWPKPAQFQRLHTIGDRVARAMHLRRSWLYVAACVATVAVAGFVASRVFSEPAHSAALSLLLVLVGAVALAVGRPSVVRAGAVVATAAVLAISAPGLKPVDIAKGWAREARTFVDNGWRERRVEAAAQAARDFFAVPSAFLPRMLGRPVAVDNFDTTVVWAYGLDWRPAPVFQQYSAYTPYLEELNAKSIRNAPADQIVLRADHSIDDRNPVWDPPRYVLAELCYYRPILSDGKWLMLQKATNRCSTATTLSRTSVAAGQAVPVPVAGAGQAVLMSFTPSTPSLVVQAGRFLYKPRHPLRVYASSPSVGNNNFRLPRALADGPLIVRFPAAARWPVLFGGADSYDQVSFSEPGTVTFKLVSLR